MHSEIDMLYTGDRLIKGEGIPQFSLEGKRLYTG
jgi:hypothetical protein